VQRPRKSEASKTSDGLDEGRRGRSLKDLVLNDGFNECAVHSSHQRLIVVDKCDDGVSTMKNVMVGSFEACVQF
jgi:hypothetical protein